MHKVVLTMPKLFSIKRDKQTKHRKLNIKTKRLKIKNYFKHRVL